MACDMPEPCKFPSLDSSLKRFLWTHKEAYLAPHPVVGLVLQVGDTEKFPHALGVYDYMSVKVKKKLVFSKYLFYEKRDCNSKLSILLKNGPLILYRI